MRFFKYIQIIYLIFLLNLTGCSDADAEFENFTAALYRSQVSSNTINLHYSLKQPADYGIENTPVTFGSFDFEPAKAMVFLENISNALTSYPYHDLSQQNQLTYDVLSYYLELFEDSIPFYLHEEPLSPFTGIHAQLPILLAEYPFYTEQDVMTYLSLLKTLPEYFNSLINFEKQKAKAGLFMSDTLADSIISECSDFAKTGESNYLISSFLERTAKLNIDGYESLNRDIVLHTVLPAYEKLGEELTKLKGNQTASQGLCYLENGEAYYKLLVRSATGSCRTPSELIQLIENQISQDQLSLWQLLQEQPSLLDEPITFSMTAEEMLSTLETEICSAFPQGANVNVELKQVPSAMGAYLSPAFYLTPAIDNYQENTIYLNPYYQTDALSLFTTLAHEGYPGHLYQTTYFNATDPDPLRTWLDFPGYTEGWATYAEMCSYYISPLEKSAETAMQKYSSLILGLYARADLGIHYDGWKFSDTLEFFNSYGIDNADAVRDIYDLIVGDPANYLSYYVGYLEILELKKEFDGSNIEFHKKLLEIGPAPFEVINQYISP